MKGSVSYRLSKFPKAIKPTKSAWVLSDVMSPGPTICSQRMPGESASQGNGFKRYFCIPCFSADSLGSQGPQFPPFSVQVRHICTDSTPLLLGVSELMYESNY